MKTEAVTGSIQDGKNGNVTYGYDNVGNRLSRTSSLAGIPNQTFSYDTNDRLNGDQYDANGNTKTAPVSQPSTTNSQQILGSDSYDSENRLTQRTGGNGNVTLVYDGDGNRVQQTVDGKTTSYLVDDRNPTGYAQVVEELVNPDQSGAGSVVNHTYTYGHDLISQDQVDPATNTWHASFYAYDGHGNVRFLTNESGQVTDTYVFDAFGTLITATGSTNNRYLYTGEQFDPNLGLYYLRARLMNPLTGRFWSMDSYKGERAEPFSLHKYLYCGANPANASDPSGHEFTLSGLMNNVTLRAYVTATNLAFRYPVIGAVATGARIGFGILTLALIASDQQFAEMYFASDGNPAAEVGYIVAEVRSARAALAYARTFARSAEALTAAESNVLREAGEIFKSPQMAKLREAAATGQTVSVEINGRTIQFQKGLPFSGFTWAEKRGFTLSDEAFASEAELKKTLLHELFRLETSAVIGQAASAEAAAQETLKAYDFAQRAYDKF